MSGLHQSSASSNTCSRPGVCSGGRGVSSGAEATLLDTPAVRALQTSRTISHRPGQEHSPVLLIQPMLWRTALENNRGPRSAKARRLECILEMRTELLDMVGCTPKMVLLVTLFTRPGHAGYETSSGVPLKTQDHPGPELF